MTRETDLASYLPEFMQAYTEPVEALEAENPEFDIMWDAVVRILNNRFTATADEYGISRFEKMLGIYPDQADTLEVRRTRVRNRWFNRVPYTIRVLAEKLAELLGGEHVFSMEPDFKDRYELVLIVYLLGNDSISQEIEHVLETMLPENMVSSIIYESGFDGAIYFGAVYDESDILEIRQR